jgi:CBS domain-containing protein
MRMYERLRRSAVGISPDATLHEAAAIMDRSGVGALAVIDGDQLVGIVTDRDVVRRGLAKGFPPDARVDSVMSTPVVTIDAEAEVHDAFHLLSRHGIRRLAVVRDDQFVGMITVDDLLIDLAHDLSDLSRPVTAEVVFGHHDSPVPVRPEA